MDSPLRPVRTDDTGRACGQPARRRALPRSDGSPAARTRSSWERIDTRRRARMRACTDTRGSRTSPAWPLGSAPLGSTPLGSTSLASTALASKSLDSTRLGPTHSGSAHGAAHVAHYVGQAQGCRDAALRDHDHIDSAEPGPRPPKPLPEQTLDSIAAHGVSNLARDRDPEPRARLSARLGRFPHRRAGRSRRRRIGPEENEHQEVLRRDPPRTAGDPLEVCPSQARPQGPGGPLRRPPGPAPIARASLARRLSDRRLHVGPCPRAAATSS